MGTLVLVNSYVRIQWCDVTEQWVSAAVCVLPVTYFSSAADSSPTPTAVPFW